MKPKSTDVLKAVKQGEIETLRDCIERFNKEANDVKDLGDIRHGLRKKSLFEIDVGLSPETSRISCDELRGSSITKRTTSLSRQSRNTAPPRGLRRGRPPEKDSARPHKERRHRFTKYTELNEVKSKILAECANAEFKDRKWLSPLVQRENTDTQRGIANTTGVTGTKPTSVGS